MITTIKCYVAEIGIFQAMINYKKTERTYWLWQLLRRDVIKEAKLIAVLCLRVYRSSSAGRGKYSTIMFASLLFRVNKGVY